MVRFFNRRHDHEAEKIEIEADVITPPEKFRRSGDYNAQQSDASGNVEITVRKQYPNTGDKEFRLDVGRKVHGDAVTFDARKIVPRKNREKRKGAIAEGYVRVFKRRKGE